MLRRIGRGEEGSLVIAVVMMMILTTLSMAALARTLGWITQIRNAQDYDGALGVADAGLSDALFQIDQNATTDHYGTGTVEASPYQWWAKRMTESEYRVEVKGKLGDAAHGVRALVTRNAKYPHALFSNQDMVFDGNGSLDIYSFLTLNHTATGQAYVGSNGKIVVNSGAGAGNAQHYYGPNAGCIGCPNPVPHDQPLELDPVEPPLNYQPCPSVDLLGNGTLVKGVFTGVIDGKSGLPYLCDDVEVDFEAVVSVVNPPLKVYVMNGNTLDIDGAVVNAGNPSKNVEIFVDGGSIDMGTGNNVADITFSGIIYAPKSKLTISGGRWWTGAIVVDQVKVNGAPNFKLGYDEELAYYLGHKWKVSRYAEIPSAEADGCVPAPNCVPTPTS